MPHPSSAYSRPTARRGGSRTALARVSDIFNTPAEKDLNFRVMGWAASTDKEPAGLVRGAPGAVGELRVVGVAPLNVDRGSRAVVAHLIDELRTELVPLLAPRWRRAVHWVDDGLVADVRYLERTTTGLLRHALARAVRPRRNE